MESNDATRELQSVVQELVASEANILTQAQHSAIQVVETNETVSSNALEDDFQVQESLANADEAGIKSVFLNCVILLGRETLQESLEFVICAGGGRVIKEITGQILDLTKLPTITHQIIDRPVSGQLLLERIYIQPQWVYDSFNSKIMLPTAPYAPGAVLPPHLSPFVDDVQEGYIPAQRNVLQQWANQPELKLESGDLTGPSTSEIKKLLQKQAGNHVALEVNEEEAYLRYANIELVMNRLL